MMLFLKIAVSVFGVFGLYSFVHLLDRAFRSDGRLGVAITVDSADAAEQIGQILKEAENALFGFKREQISVIIMEKNADKELLSFLQERQIDYYIVKKEP